MKANGNGNLQKLYGALTPRERMAALVEAIARGDTNEADALTNSAPHKEYAIPHHRKEVEAFVGVSLTYAINQLSTGMRMMSLLLWSDPDKYAGDFGDKGEEFDAARRYAFTASELAYAWGDFCKELGVSEKTAAQLTDVSEDIGTIVTVARTLSPKPEDATVFWAKRGHGELPSREKRLIGLRNAYNEIAHRGISR